MNRLEIERQGSNGEVWLHLRGELDISTAEALEAQIRSAEGGSPPGRLVLDLRGLEFMDSTGLRLIVMADQRMTKEGARLQLVRGPEAVHRVFRLALLEERLSFVNADEEGGDGRAHD
jgi:anti-sigma B factor antagonist